MVGMPPCVPQSVQQWYTQGVQGVYDSGIPRVCTTVVYIPGIPRGVQQWCIPGYP